MILLQLIGSRLVQNQGNPVNAIWRISPNAPPRSAPLVLVVTGVNLMSLLDAIVTLLLLGDDSRGELNPLMGALIERNYLHFLLVKSVLTFIGTVICWHYYDRKRSARTMLTWISRAYCGLMIWQGLLLSGILSAVIARLYPS